ncbi:MAG TPA: gamma carbonic anhydrase family protein [Phycisphaerae bacterium]|nr:gamma carbonic anhydrase family protein [Phycisphaerae bacterium]
MAEFISNSWMEKVGQHWQATNAVICGEVNIGLESSIWFGACIRGDVAPITLGHAVNVQEGAVLHCDTGEPLVIGNQVTIGHGAIVHCKSVGDGTLIGMNAVVLGRVVIGKNCIVAAGAVVSPGTQVPDGSVVMGVPAKVIRPVRDSELQDMRTNNRHYVELAKDHAEHPEKFYQWRPEA